MTNVIPSVRYLQLSRPGLVRDISLTTEIHVDTHHEDKVVIVHILYIFALEEQEQEV